MAAGFECGIVLRNYADIKEGDVIEVYDTKQVERTLSRGCRMAPTGRTSCCSKSTSTSRTAVH